MITFKRRGMVFLFNGKRKTSALEAVSVEPSSVPPAASKTETASLACGNALIAVGAILHGSGRAMVKAGPVEPLPNSFPGSSLGTHSSKLCFAGTGIMIADSTPTDGKPELPGGAFPNWSLGTRPNSHGVQQQFSASHDQHVDDGLQIGFTQSQCIAYVVQVSVVSQIVFSLDRCQREDSLNQECRQHFVR